MPAPSSSQRAPAVVRCQGLTKRFRDFWLRPRVEAVHELDLEIAPGEVFGLLGPNGSGKSTTIKMLLGLLFPSAGQVELFGRAPTDVQAKSRLGYLPEETHLYPFLNANETLDFYGRLFGLPRAERRRRADELIDMVGLSSERARPVGEYSKGMQRRIGLAQALINDPDFLVLDEPTSGLDPVGTRQVKDLLIELGRRGKTLLLSSHLLADVEDVCERVAILYGGRIVSQGRIDELLTVKSETLIACDRLTPDEIECVRREIESHGRKWRGVEERRQRLEQLFLDLVESAQTDGQRTSGAHSTIGLAPFLSHPSSAPTSTEGAALKRPPSREDGVA